MTTNILVANIRNHTGKGHCRKLRVDNKLPAVLYTKNEGSKTLTLCPKETTKMLMGPHRRNVVINLSIEDGNSKTQKLVMVKERQIHITKRNLIHVDFVEVLPNVPVVVSVPVKLFGKSESVTLGGNLEHVLQKMKVSCLPKNVPESIEVDITRLGFGSTHAKDVTLPEGISLAEKPTNVVLTIKKPRGATKEEEAKEGQPAAAKGKK